MGGTWVCETCIAAGIEQGGPDSVADIRCSVCEEPRAKHFMVPEARGSSSSGAVARSFSQWIPISRQMSMSSSISRQTSMSSTCSEDWDWDTLSMTPKAAEMELRGLEADLAEINERFGEGCAKWRLIGSRGICVDLYFRPFDKDRHESLPEEVCRAWGLSQTFAPPVSTYIVELKRCVLLKSRQQSSRSISLFTT